MNAGHPDRRRAVSRLALGAAALLARPAPAQAGSRILLGASCALSGPSAQLGIQFNRGARLYFDRVNAAGGVNGQPIELKTLDDGYEPDRCKANTEALIQRDQVYALFGYVGTPTSLAALPLAVDAGVPFFGPCTGAEALRDPFRRNVFHVRASYYDETALIVRQLTGLGLKRIAVFRQDDSYGQAGLDGVLRALAPLGLKPVAVGLVGRNKVDVAAAVRAIVPLRPDAVIQISAYKSCAAFIRQARAAGYGGTFYNVSFVGTQALADELGRDALGVVVSQVMPYPVSTTLPITREFLAAVQHAGGGASANYSSIEGYIDAKILVEGLRRAGPRPTREALIAGLEGLGHHDVGGFSVDFSPRSHRGSDFVELSMLTGDGKVRV
ncbi:MAG: ABC transporter substrate-binding protein [Burkholderiales bacterium]|nr:ABC transporter substrate-binding protein [Burkholderiales bacterium]MDE1929392.1 ABC transporter substrate-binding protein [Burkholderiales bacterium]MDE2161060.1 ABC transporter substrate-binding protein [Burkholderiales bacterium]MDE2504088.1 ABC transporter substrate-binding protein [Burkholderiales bacterium]